MHKLSKEQWKVYNAVINCKTQGLGIHTITCEGCGEIIKVELLNNHKLDFCINKNNYKKCNKCKEAIPNEVYNLHLEKNVCNPIKLDMSRCPFCHHDIEKEQEGFYQHLIIDGCAYQVYN